MTGQTFVAILAVAACAAWLARKSWAQAKSGGCGGCGKCGPAKKQTPRRPLEQGQPPDSIGPTRLKMPPCRRRAD